MSTVPEYRDDIGAWWVRDPAHVRQVLLDPETFDPANALTAVHPISPENLRTLSRVGFALPPTLANNATATHAEIRSVVARYFSAGMVKAVEPEVRGVARAHLRPLADRLRAGQHVDLVSGYCAEAPAQILLTMLDLKEVDVAALKRWSADSLELFWGFPGERRQRALAASASEFYAWLDEWVRRDIRDHSEGLFASLASLGISHTEVCAAAYFLMVAGHETTTQLVSTVLWTVASEPERWWGTAVDVPTAASALVDDVLSARSSVPTWRRVTTRHTQVGGVDLPAGATVLLQLTDTGADASLAFGVGVHRCLGVRLALLEATIAVEEAVNELPPIRVSEMSPPMLDLVSFQAPRRVLVEPIGQSVAH
ncbi:MAG TPA: cytochrome P450 [Actinomycetes bacterium]|nr:cytochrome P450 [Actinomycetes bacterium]